MYFLDKADVYTWEKFYMWQIHPEKYRLQGYCKSMETYYLPPRPYNMRQRQRIDIVLKQRRGPLGHFWRWLLPHRYGIGLKVLEPILHVEIGYTLI